MPRRKKARRVGDNQLTLSVLPMQLHIGDLITNEAGDWEVISRPVTYAYGHEVRARVKRLGESATTKTAYWPAHERLTIQRAP